MLRPRARGATAAAAGRGVAAAVALASILVASLATMPARSGTLAAQSAAFVSLIVVDHAGALLPIEQFRSQMHEGCPRGAGVIAQAHFHPSSGGPAIALDGAEVADPDLQGCGFGLTTSGLPESAHVRIAEVAGAALVAWTQRTGIEVVPLPSSSSPAVPGPATALDRAVAGDGARPLVIVALALAAGLAAGTFVYARARGATARRQADDRDAGDEPALDRHPGMLALADFTPSPVDGRNRDAGGGPAVDRHRGMLALSDFTPLPADGRNRDAGGGPGVDRHPGMLALADVTPLPADRRDEPAPRPDEDAPPPAP